MNATFTDWVTEQISQLGELSTEMAEFLIRQQEVLVPNEHWILIPSLSDDRQWNLLSPDAEMERQARDLVKAFLGPVLGDVGKNSEIIERLGDGTSLKKMRNVTFIASSDVSEAEIIRSVSDMLDVLEAKPPLKEITTDPIAQLLRDFEFSLNNEDRGEAGNMLIKLRDNGTLGDIDLIHLRIAYDFTFGDYEKIVNQNLRHLCNLEMPRRINEYILNSFWKLEFSSLSEEQMIDHFGLSIVSSLTNLFNHPKPTNSLGVKCLVALFLRKNPNSQTLERLKRSLTNLSEQDVELVKRLVGEDFERIKNEDDQPVNVSSSILHKAKLLRDENNYHELASLALQNIEEREIFVMSMEATINNQDQELAKELVDSLNQLNEETSKAIKPELKQQLIELAESLCSGWLQWFSRINSDTPWDNAASIAKDDSVDWDLTAFDSASEVGVMQNHFDSALEGNNKEQVLATLPAICKLAGQLPRNQQSENFIKSVLVALLEVESPSKSVVTSFLLLAESLVSDLDHQLSEEMYVDVLEQINHLWEKIQSPAYLDWAFSVIEMLAFFPAPSVPARMNLLIAMFPLVTQYQGHVQIEDLTMVHRVNHECELNFQLPPMPKIEEEVNIWKQLEGKKVHVYTLLQGLVLNRFEQQLKEMAGTDQIDVMFNSSLHGGDGLKQFAQGADYLIVDTWHSQHAATGSIDQVVPPEEQIRPDTGGRGCRRYITKLKQVLERDNN